MSKSVMCVMMVVVICYAVVASTLDCPGYVAGGGSGCNAVLRSGTSLCAIFVFS